MAGEGQKSEKPTPGRLRKAREEGRFASSRDLIASTHLILALAVGVAAGSEIFADIENVAVFLFQRAFQAHPLTAGEFVHIYRSTLIHPLVLIGRQAAYLTAAVLLLQMFVTQFGFSTKQLVPSFGKLDPRNRLRQIPKQNLFGAVKAAVLLPVIGLLLYTEVYRRIPEVVALAAAPLGSALAQTGSILESLLWRLCLALLVLGAADFLRERQRLQSELRMTKQEVRDEHKESEGNPQMKMRIRRLQRDAARRSMLKALPKATAVIVNPTHYAIALQYEMNSKAVPSVVAKGKNFLAQTIRNKAIEYEIPVIENKPLAQALYQAVEVGQEIPPHLYRAVAEVLAYIYRTLTRR